MSTPPNMTVPESALAPKAQPVSQHQYRQSDDQDDDSPTLQSFTIASNWLISKKSTGDLYSAASNSSRLTGQSLAFCPGESMLKPLIKAMNRLLREEASRAPDPFPSSIVLAQPHH